MKLLIDETLSWQTSFALSTGAEDSADPREAIEAMFAELRRCSVWGVYEVDATSARAQIQAQKVCLDEFEMNRLFDEALNLMFEFRFEYSALGGAGSGLALRVVDAHPRPF